MLSAAAALLSARGKTEPGLIGIIMHVRRWWRIFGDKIKPIQDMLLTQGGQNEGLSNWSLCQTGRLHSAIPDQTVMFDKCA